jgi:hypothetical protein
MWADLSVGSFLGRGGFGEVWKGTLWCVFLCVIVSDVF